MVLLRYLTDCDEAVQAKVRDDWAQTEEWVTRIGANYFLDYEPVGDAHSTKRLYHNWVIFDNDQAVGIISASITEQPSSESAAPADYPSLGTVTYIDPTHRRRGFASAAKLAILRHEAASGVRSFACVVEADNPYSLRSIANAGYKLVSTEPVEGKPDKLHYRRWTSTPWG